MKAPTPQNEPERLAALASLGEDLRLVLQTSAATLEAVNSEDEQRVDAVASEHAKCERCWHYRPEVGSIAEETSAAIVQQLTGGKVDKAAIAAAVKSVRG